MKYTKIIVLLILIWSSLSPALSGDTVSVSGHIKSLDADAVILQTEDSKISVPRKFLKIKASVGEKVSIQIPKASFASIKTLPLK